MGKLPIEDRKMRIALWNDAVQKHACEPEHAEVCRKIESVEYRLIDLSEPDFNRLVTMRLKEPEMALRLMPAGKSRTIGAITARLLEMFPSDRPLDVFYQATLEVGWFEQCFILATRFDKRIMGELHVRPLTEHEHYGQPADAQFYVEDGAHRALAYAMQVALGVETYEPVSVIFSEDWSHIYPWGVKR